MRKRRVYSCWISIEMLGSLNCFCWRPATSSLWYYPVLQLDLLFSHVLFHVDFLKCLHLIHNRLLLQCVALFLFASVLLAATCKCASALTFTFSNFSFGCASRMPSTAQPQGRALPWVCKKNYFQIKHWRENKNTNFSATGFSLLYIIFNSKNPAKK